jgi:glycosyltransferase involved in cell wall biosynthesis
MRVLTVIPAFNEAGSLPAVVADIRAHVRDAEILIVDDASTDGTADLLPHLGVRWLRMPQRLGTGPAVRTGLRYAASLGFDTIVRIDGDGQHLAQGIEALLAPLRRDDADVVIGSRYIGGGSPPTGAFRRLSQRALGAVLTLMTGQRVTDPTSGFWAFGGRALKLLVDHHPSGYPEPELLLFLNRNSVRVMEVPVTMRDRLAGQTSLTPQRTGAAMARLLLLLVIVPLRSTVGDSHD